MKSSFLISVYVLLACTLTNPGILKAQEKDKETAKLVFEPLSLTISKLDRNVFGQGVDPFKLFSNSAVSGTKLLVKGAPDPSFKARLVPSGAKLDAVRDDRGTDLLTLPKGEKLNPFWENNRNLEVVQSPEGDEFGLEIRAPKAPSPDATRIVVEGTLLFAPAAAGMEAKHGPLTMEPDKAVEIGPVQLKFSQPRDRGAPKGLWLVRILPGPDVVNASLLLFGEDKEVPIRDTASRLGSTFSSNGVVSYGFTCPDGELSRIVLRYASRDKLIEVPFQLETGLGDFTGGGRTVNPLDRLREPGSGSKSPPAGSILVGPDSTWHWLHPVNGIDPATGDPDFHRTFFTAAFDDTAWKTGKDGEGTAGGFGYGDAWFKGVDIGKPATKELGKSAYFRCRFKTDKAHTTLELSCQRDDGIIIYLDGREVARDNMGKGEEAYRLPATKAVSDAAETRIVRIRLKGISLPAGDHILAISLHNPKMPSTDLRIGGITLREVEAVSTIRL